MWGYGLDRAGSGQGQVAGTCDCGNERSGSIKWGGFLDQLKTGQLLKKDSAPWSELYIYIYIYMAKCRKTRWEKRTDQSRTKKEKRSSYCNFSLLEDSLWMLMWATAHHCAAAYWTYVHVHSIRHFKRSKVVDIGLYPKFDKSIPFL